MSEDTKTVLVTGSGTGIGQAVARRFAKEGYNIIILGRRREPLVEASSILNDIIKESGFKTKVKYYSGIDVSEENGINSLFENIKDDFGKIDIIVNNAGVSGPVKIFTNSNYQEFKECVSIHLTGTFWTSVKGLETLNKNGKIITISTFFTEENKFEQRPYRFRTPYTAAQGAKNRLVEALAWELVEKDIKSIGTNPGPVHSDRIYKTVYPKAAAEFLRIGGFEGLSNKQIESANVALLPFLGEDNEIIEKETLKFAENMKREENLDIETEQLQLILTSLLEKIQSIAEKIQYNTKKMIVDKEFLSQDDVAEMVYDLSTDSISKLVNGKIIPNDRVFYPVKPIINRCIDIKLNCSLEGKLILLTTTTEDIDDIEEIKKIADNINDSKVKQLIVLTNKNKISNEINEKFKQFHHHSIDFQNEESVKRIFNTINSKFGKLDCTIHFTGSIEYSNDITTLQRNQWDNLVNNFINIPHLVTRESVLSMATQDALQNPNKFKNSFGNIIIVGPKGPTGEKIDGRIRARSEIFRGALRPYITTANQELHDVLESHINLTLILQGSINGSVPDFNKLADIITGLAAQKELRNNSILYIDE